jgi:uncharacterized protein YndB with AHSA1/START domain
MSEPFVIERSYNAPIEKVWNAISNPDQMRQWYFPVSGFKPQVGFEFHFTGNGSKGEEYIHECKVLEAKPMEKLQYSWSYKGHEGYSVLTFELFPEGSGTRLKLTHEGLESFAGNGPDFQPASFAMGWTEITGKMLKEYVE